MAQGELSESEFTVFNGKLLRSYINRRGTQRL